MSLSKIIYSWATIFIVTVACTLLAKQGQESLSPAATHRVQIVLKEFFGVVQPQDVHIKSLSGGYSATSLMLEVAGKKYVLRLIKEEELPIRVKKEIYAMEQAAKAGVAPAVHWVSADGHAVLMDFVEGGTLHVEQAKRSETIVNVAGIIRCVHELPKSPYRAPSFREYMELFYKYTLQQSTQHALLEEAMALLRQQDDKLQSLNSPQVSIHGDLNPRNILAKGHKLYFIDWSEGMYAEPFHDLAYFAVLMDYNSEENALLLKSYLQHCPTSEEKERFAIARKLNFARLAIGAQYVVNKLRIEKGETFDPCQPPREWSYYAKAFADNSEGLSAQFFWGLAQAALQSAHAISEVVKVHDEP